MQVLLRVVKGELLGRAWLLTLGEYVIGRAPACQIRLTRNSVRNADSICVSSTTFQVQIYMNDIWTFNEIDGLRCKEPEEPDDFSCGPIASLDLLGDACLTRSEYLELIEQARLAGKD
jgi:hypothetical protein